MKHAFLIAVALLAAPLSSEALEVVPAIHVVEGQGCECCVKWTEYLQQQGFDVTAEERFGVLLIQHKGTSIFDLFRSRVAGSAA